MWGAKTGAAVVHAAKMPTQYILARESMQVQCDGAMADVKMLPAFTKGVRHRVASGGDASLVPLHVPKMTVMG